MQVAPLVFISYAREDEREAKRLCEDLKQAGANPWFDKESLLPGENWRASIQSAIRRSDFCIVLFSTASVNKKGYVQREVKEALEVLKEFPGDRIFLLPARLEECHPSHQGVKDLQWVDLFPSWEAGFEKLRTVMNLATLDRDQETLQKEKQLLQKEIQLLQGKLKGYQQALEYKGYDVSKLQVQLAELRDKTYPLLLESYMRKARDYSQGKREALAVLFLDLASYSTLDETRQLNVVSVVRETAEPILRRYSSRYHNTWGDAIVAGFDKPGEGIVCACKLIEHLKVEGLSTRIGMSHGMLSVSYDQVKGGLNMDGPPMSEGARLEPLAKPGEVLISKALRFHPEIAEDGRFEFEEQKRPLKKAVGELPAGHEIKCWSVRFKG